MKLPTLGLEEREFDSLPPALRRKYFSSLERLRLAQDGSFPSRHSRPERHSRRHSLRSRSSLRDRSSCIDPHHTSNLAAAFSRRLRRTQSTTASYLALRADAEWFWSLPSKIQQTHFSREEQILFAGTRDSIILDAADESLLRLRQEITSRSRDPSKVPVTTMSESPPVDSAIEIDDGLFNGFRWNEDEDELDLSLDEYHAAIADTVDSGQLRGKCKPSFRRTLSVGSIQFPRTSLSFRKPSISSKARPVTTTSSSSHLRTGSTFLPPRHKSHASVSSIDPAAKHYRDPEARLKLRVYLASPQKFDEAIEFGFPSIEKNDKSLYLMPATSPRITVESDRSFLKDDADSLFDDDAAGAKDDASLTDSDSPHTPQDPVFQPVTLSGATSLDRPCSARPLVPRKSPESHMHACAAKREMTLHMTLTRPDLRTTDGPVVAPADESLHITALPLPREQQSVWDSLPAESSRMKRLWKRIRKA